MYRIGLTGGIGTGKSTVSRYLAAHGLDVIDADQIARELVEPGSLLLSKLAERFGKDILLEDGTLDRKGLGALVFADDSKKAAMDQLMQGEIIEVIRQRAERLELLGRQAVVIDAPLLLESDLRYMVQTVWLVDTEPELQLKRVMERDGLSRELILDRMRHQMPGNEKKRLANVIIDNSKDLPHLYEQLDSLIRGLRVEG